MSDDFLRGLAFEIAQLRHAYAHLSAERVTRQRMFADGLIAPAIRFLEEVYAEAADQRVALAAGSGTAETGETPAQCEASQSGPDRGNAQKAGQ